MGEAGILAGFTMAPLTPEQQARERIDQMLVASGWAVQDKKAFNPSASLGVAVREYDTDAGPADYILFVDRVPVGVVEAKKPTEAEKFTVHKDRAEGNATSKLPIGRCNGWGLPNGTNHLASFQPQPITP